jgi:hypothetical protein
MATVRTTSRETGNRREKTIAIQFSNENEQPTSRIRDAMILLAIVMLGTAVGTHAFAAGRMGGGVGFSGGFVPLAGVQRWLAAGFFRLHHSK